MKQILIFLLVLPCSICSQDTLILSADQLLTQVENNHPAMRQAELLDDQSAAYTLKAKAAFDPSIAGGYDAKSFQDKNYYRELDAKLKVPTRIGPDISVGYARSSGDFLDSSDFLPENGLSSFGISIPLGNGLLFDERRKGLKDAKIFMQNNDLQQQLLTNRIKVLAASSYLQWQLTNEQLSIFREAVSLASTQLGQVKLSFEAGDKPAVDTLEYAIILQSRLINLRKAEQQFELAKNQLELFVWSSELSPLGIEDNVYPERMDSNNYQDELEQINIQIIDIIRAHPELSQYDLKIEKLNIEQRLNREYLKPDINISFHPLVQIDQNNRLLDYNLDDYKLGIDFYYPLFTRKAKAEIKLVDIEIESAQLDQTIKRQELEIKLQNIIQNDQAYATQVTLLEQNVTQSLALLEAERLKFRLGESTVFLLNKREQKYLDTRLKLLELRSLLIQNQIKLLELSVADF